MQGKRQKVGKTLAHGGNGYVSVQQRTNQSVRFSATNGHVPAGRQLLGEESAEHPMGQA